MQRKGILRDESSIINCIYMHHASTALKKYDTDSDTDKFMLMTSATSKVGTDSLLLALNVMAYAINVL